jgi:hypothetical protein
VERFERSGVVFGGVDPRVLFISTRSGHTGLTGAFHRSDRCRPLLGFARVNVLVSSLLSLLVEIGPEGRTPTQQPPEFSSSFCLLPRDFYFYLRKKRKC